MNTRPASKGECLWLTFVSTLLVIASFFVGETFFSVLSFCLLFYWSSRYLYERWFGDEAVRADPKR